MAGFLTKRGIWTQPGTWEEGCVKVKAEMAAKTSAGGFSTDCQQPPEVRRGQDRFFYTDSEETNPVNTLILGF